MPRLLCPLLAVLAAAAALVSCEEAFTEVVDVEADGPAPPVLFAKFTTADDTLRVFLFEGQTADADEFPQPVAGATLSLEVDGAPAGQFALRPELVTDEQSFFFSRVGEDDVIERGVYALPLPQRLRPGQSLTLSVALPDGTAFALSQNLPPAPDFRLARYAAPGVDTVRFDSSGSSFNSSGGELELRIARADLAPDAVSYYRFFMDVTYLDSVGNVVREDFALPLYPRDEERARLDELPYGLFSDRDVTADTLSQDFSTPLFALRFDDLSCERNRFGGREEECVPGLGRAVEIYGSTITRAGADYYTDLARTFAAGNNPFAEPVALTSQAEGVIAHLVVESMGERRVRRVE